MRKLLTLLSLTLIAMTSAADVTYTNGFGDDDSYEPATLVNGYYEIDNGGKLFWFAQQVNAGTGANYKAKLTADINLDGDNHLWTPIGSNAKQFKGAFDGQGHKITGLKVETDAEYTAFIGLHNTNTAGNDLKDFSIYGKVKYTGNTDNHCVAGVVAWACGTHKTQDVWCFVDVETPNANGTNVRIGGVVGKAQNATTIDRCVYSGTLNGYSTAMQAAGIVGWINNANITISNCLFNGTIKTLSDAYVGGIAGFCGNAGGGSTLSNNLSIGSFELPATTTHSGILIGQKSAGTYTNNYVLKGNGLDKVSASSISATAISAAQLTNGTLPAQLSPHNWIQGTNSPIPSFNPLNHVFGSNGFCSYCDDGYQPATLVGNYYEIDNGGKLFWLAQQVNNGTGTAYDAKLTADIDLENRAWTPMGNATNKYTGEFDGQGYSISNLSVSGNTDGTAFIGYHDGTKDIKNFSLSGNVTYTGNSEHCIGGLLAYNTGANTIQDIVCNVNVSAPSATGNVRMAGIAARVALCTFDRCTYSGIVNGYGTKMQVAGIVGLTNDAITVKNCLFNGKLISTYSTTDGTSAYVGGLAGYTYYKITAQNNLFIGTIEVPDGASMYVGALIGGKRNTSTSGFSNNYVMLNGTNNVTGTGYTNTVTVNQITSVNEVTASSLGTANWAQNTGNPVPKAFTCTESNGGAAATVTGTVCAYNFDVFKNAVTDYATVDMSGANMTSNIADTDVESLLTNNSLVYVPSTTEYCGKNIVNDGICDDFELTEGKPFAPTTGFEASAASYKRTVSNNWGTICLPYEVESDENVTYYTTGTINGDVLTLTSADVISAGTPAICKFTTTGENTIESYVVNVCTDVAEDTQSDDITLIGSFAKQTILAADVPNAYYISGGKFWHATGTLTVNPFRAYFTTNSASPSNGFSITVDDDNVTAIQALTGESDVTVTAIYTADGKQIGELQNGLNIVKFSNGKTTKIMLK